MALLQKLGQGQGHLKAGFLGFQKSGKTWTAALLAAGTRRYFGLTGPVAMYDTEGGSEYIAPLIRKETGTDLMGVKSRAFSDLVTMGRECVASGVSVLIVDSVTHVWRELCDAFLSDLNSNRSPGRRIKRLEFQHWSAVKGQWEEWTTFYLNAPLHIIIAGRAGYEYDMEMNEETQKKELVKTGIKMKTEGEFGFEPSLLVQMDRVQEPDGNGGFVLRRQATVLGDRFGVIDGRTVNDPTFDFFEPHLRMLKPGAHATIDTQSRTQTGADENGDDEWARERRTRAILCEEIQGELVAAWPGQSAAEKKAKGDIIHSTFNTRSWTAVENMDSGKLRAGLASMRAAILAQRPAATAEAANQEVTVNA